MNNRLKIMSIFGTRPEAIKMAPLVLELERRFESVESIVTVTAQHREMLDQVLSVFSIEPDYDLNIMQQEQTLVDITSKALVGLDQVMKDARPDVVLVHGDTTTTFIASLAAFYNGIKVGHIEAGLRTYNKLSPFPEEMNRQLTGVIADFHFAPTEQARKNLLQENKAEKRIFVTGNTVIDALQTTVKKNYTHPLLEKVGQGRLILLTAHRRENLGKNMVQMFRAIRRLVDQFKDIHVVYPVHLNPKVQQTAQEVLQNHSRIDLIQPLELLDFHNFMARSHLILTDSGGIQEEAPSLGVPVLVLRHTTERPEGIEAGTLKLAGTEEETIYKMAKELLSNDQLYEKMSQAKNPYGDGRASKRIADQLEKLLKEEF